MRVGRRLDPGMRAAGFREEVEIVAGYVFLRSGIDRRECERWGESFNGVIAFANSDVFDQSSTQSAAPRGSRFKCSAGQDGFFTRLGRLIKEKAKRTPRLMKDNASVIKLIKIQMPSSLRKQLIDDRESVTKHNKLIKLPRSPTVDEILTKYHEDMSKNDPAIAYEVEHLLVNGRKKEALECAKQGKLWGPTLVLAAQLGDQVQFRSNPLDDDCVEKLQGRRRRLSITRKINETFVE